MKILFTCSQILLLSILIFAQTTDEIPSPESVLVVYANPMNGDSTSFKIMSHYVEVQNIPFSNIVTLDFLDTPESVTDPQTNVTHQIEIQQGEGNEKEIIPRLSRSRVCLNTVIPNLFRNLTSGF